MRAIFLGTPAFALPSLRAVATLCDLAAVVAQPDRPRGRGQRSGRPPTAGWADAHGVRVLQPEKVRTPEFLAELLALAPDLLVVVAYGRILPRAVLELPARGAVNVHASLLPRYRGAAPIQWAIASGETETGATLMRMEEGLDSGPILLQRALAIGPGETSEELAARLAELGAELLCEGLPRLEAGALDGVRQDAAQVTLAPLLSREDGWLDLSLPASLLHDRVRAFQPWPGAACGLPGGGVLKILSTAVAPGAGAPGELLASGAGELRVATGRGALQLLFVQPEGGRRMAVAEFLAGHPLRVGSLFVSLRPLAPR